MTLAACALLGFSTAPSLLFGLSFFTGIGGQDFLLHGTLGLVGGCLLGAVLLKQGGISVPSRQEKGATRGALVGLVVGLAAVFLLSVPAFEMLGACALVGLAVGRTFDRSSIRPTELP